MMSWNYRIMRHVDERGGRVDAYYAIHEVYYREDGGVDGWTQEPCGSPFGETLDEMVKDLAWIAAGLARPVLDFDDGTELGAAPLLGDELMAKLRDMLPPPHTKDTDNT